MSEAITFGEFVQWVGTPAGLFGMGSVLSMFLREYDKFQDLTKSQKALSMLVLNIIILPLAKGIILFFNQIMKSSVDTC